MGVISWIFILIGAYIGIQVLRAGISMLYDFERFTFLDWIKLIGLFVLMGTGGVLLEEGNIWGVLPMIILIALLYDWYGQLKRFIQRRKIHQENLKREESIRRGKEFMDSFPVNNSLAGKSFIRKVSKKK